jgi:hypothetical protein
MKYEEYEKVSRNMHTIRNGQHLFLSTNCSCTILKYFNISCNYIIMYVFFLFNFFVTNLSDILYFEAITFLRIKKKFF